MLVTATIFLLIVSSSSQNVLSTVYFQDTITTGQPISSNFVGLSLSYPNIRSTAMSSTLFAQLVKNSWVFGSTTASWGVSLKMQYPVGYKWDCPNSWMMVFPTPTCTVNVKPQYFAIGTFLKSITNSFKGVSLGFDRQGINLAGIPFQIMSFSWYFDFISNIGSMGGVYPVVEMYDKADTYQAQGLTPQTYNPAAFLAEVQSLTTSLPIIVMGPGLSTAASSSWKDTQKSFSSTNYFSTYAAPFTAQSQLTISNVLNEVNYQTYLRNLFSGSTGILDPTSGNLVITELVMFEGTGVDGVSNAMVSAIWALDTLLEGARFGLKRINLKADPSSTDFLSVFGAAPNYDPQPIYYALLMMSIIQQTSNTYFLSPSVLQGSSSSIKVHALKAGNTVSLILLNKDTNSSASGVVTLNSSSRADVSCIYLSATSLSSKTVTLAGMSLTSGNSTLQGSYT
jgi:hypothetical protein